MVGDGGPTSGEIRDRHERILARLRRTASENGHDPDRLRIVAVTKTWPVEVARAAVDAGITSLGESRIQEAEAKIAELPTVEWHFIGRIQSNKLRRAVRGFRYVHSVDSLDLAARADELVAEERRDVRYLLQVNVTGEQTKAGFAPEDLMAAAPALRDSHAVGLMTIAPMDASFADARAVFRGLRELRDQLEDATGAALPELSMGMSADADAAAAEGATLVRIGTALFGPREATLVSSPP